MEVKNIPKIMGVILVPVLIVCFLSMYLYSGYYNNGGVDPDKAEQVFAFVKPALAQYMGAELTFLDEEAGLSLYLNINASIDLAVAKTVFRGTPERETTDYVVGSVALPNLTENEDVHCFVHKDGWIVVYYLNGEPASKIVDWNLWSQSSSKLDQNKLEVGLKQMTNRLQKSSAGAAYYDFHNPNATKCIVVFETLVGSGEDSFNITIPNDLTVYEKSWSHYAETTRWDGYSWGRSDFKIDGNLIDSISQVDGPMTIYTQILYGDDKLDQLGPHTVSVSGNQYNILYGICVALVYQEP